MKISLAYRLATMPLTSPPPSMLDQSVDSEQIAAFLTTRASLVRRADKFRFDNVAEFYAQHDREVWDLSEDIPNFAPPFQDFFAEWEEPREWNMSGRLEKNDADTQVGCQVLALDVTDANRGDVGGWRRLFGSLIGAIPETFADHCFKGLAESRWVLHAHPWLASNQLFGGKPFWPGVFYFVFVSHRGRCVNHFCTGLVIESYRQAGQENQLYPPLHVLGLGLSFCHCKNVTRREVVEDHGERWHRRTKAPRFRYHLLDIDPMREVLRREGRSAEIGIQKALHVCRGHFATYTEDSPLFGKYVGTFWRPDHVRGKISQGVVGKEYRVKAGEVAP